MWQGLGQKSIFIEDYRKAQEDPLALPHQPLHLRWPHGGTQWWASARTVGRCGWTALWHKEQPGPPGSFLLAALAGRTSWLKGWAGLGRVLKNHWGSRRQLWSLEEGPHHFWQALGYLRPPPSGSHQWLPLAPPTLPGDPGSRLLGPPPLPQFQGVLSLIGNLRKEDREGFNPGNGVCRSDFRALLLLQPQSLGPTFMTLPYLFPLPELPASKVKSVPTN